MRLFVTIWVIWGAVFASAGCANNQLTSTEYKNCKNVAFGEYNKKLINSLDKIYQQCLKQAKENRVTQEQANNVFSFTDAVISLIQQLEE